MLSFRDIYERFKKNYRTDTGGINLYPQFDSDLELLLSWLEVADELRDVGVDGDWLDTDCSWCPPIGEDD